MLLMLLLRLLHSVKLTEFNHRFRSRETVLIRLLPLLQESGKTGRSTRFGGGSIRISHRTTI